MFVGVVATESLKAADTVMTLTSPTYIVSNVVSSFAGIASAWHEALRRQSDTGLGQDS